MTHKTGKTDRKEADARERLIEAGIDVFGQHGFEGASTRRLAAEAGVNIAAIPYYYGSKEGLYKAVVEEIVQRVRERLAPEIASANDLAMREDATEGELIAELQRLLTAMALTIIGSPEAKRWARIVLQEQIKPSEAFEILFQGFFKRMLGACGTLLSRLTRLSAESEELIFLAQAILGQVLIFRIGETALLRRLDREQLTPGQVSKLAGLIAVNVEAITRNAIGMAAGQKGKAKP
ncbi:CerR family C-terminal domain-containing protein [Desulfocurvibacter africanus]|uniref:CerR family C-terminal domain-containing protein n=1 Tax=Desulfocurvibacter africanus TaxID=873 RepID=UPI000426FB24|nr:CerR family C-terminal domain-containing protein [Desulfocurvibacter africanus]